MECLFIEMPIFERVRESLFGSDEEFRTFQTVLGQNPQIGDVIPGGSPLRKVRWGDRLRGKGKRGGFRVIYLHSPERRCIFLIYAYPKTRKDDLTARELRILRGLAGEIRTRETRAARNSE